MYPGRLTAASHPVPNMHRTMFFSADVHRGVRGRRCAPEPQHVGHRHQLGWGAAPCEEVRGGRLGLGLEHQQPVPLRRQWQAIKAAFL